MQRIEVDGAQWRSEDDLWDAVLGALGAPEWHGRNFDAIFDSVGEPGFLAPDAARVNRVQAPFEIVVVNAGELEGRLRDRLTGIAETLEAVRKEFGLQVSLSVR